LSDKVRNGTNQTFVHRRLNGLRHMSVIPDDARWYQGSFAQRGCREALDEGEEQPGARIREGVALEFQRKVTVERKC
jgi:hypothetical protein